MHRAVPVTCPHAIFGAGAGRPAQHRLLERDVDPCAQLAQHGARIEQELFRVQHRRVLPQRPQVAQQLDVRPIANVFHRRAFDLPGVAWQHIQRVTGQEDVGGFGEEAQIEVGQVMRHVLEKRHRPGLVAQKQVAHHRVAVLLHARDHLLGAGMVGARRRPGQVMGIERLVVDYRVIPLGEGIHQRRGNVARPAPQANAYDLLRHGYASPLAATTARSISARYSAVSRSVIGPSWPSPIRRPSTLTTGVSPPKVPVTNASSAP